MIVRIDQGKLSFDPKPRPEAFASVARLIAKSDPPDWLRLALAHVAHFISLAKQPRDVKLEEEMLRSAECLERGLPI
jgi:hypothetical protein